jgi:hypothetical protein
VANLPSVSTTPVVQVAKFAASVDDTGGNSATGVVDTGGKFAAGVVDTVENLPPVSLIQVVHLLANISANFRKNLKLSKNYFHGLW